MQLSSSRLRAPGSHENITPPRGFLRAVARLVLSRFPRAKARLAALYDAWCVGGLDVMRAQVTDTQHRLNETTASLYHAEYQFRRFMWRYNSVAAELWGPPERPPAPPERMPDDLRDAYTMQGRVPVVTELCDGTWPSNHPLIYTDEEIDWLIDAYIRRKKHSIYGVTDDWLWEAFSRYPITGQSVAVMGSLTPWYEATCIHFGGNPTTIEYSNIISRSSRLRTMTVAEYDRSPIAFDAAISISSFEHDGLGAYGDPLDPDGDLKAMRKMLTTVRKGGLLYFAVPLGADAVYWNGKRVYGRLRLPLLLSGWEVVDRIGYDDALLDINSGLHPILVLRNPG